MTPKSNEPTSARGPEDMERKGRTRRETVMAHEATVIEDNGSDDDDYQPSNEGDRTVMPENAGATPMIDAFDYVSPNHPLRPARAICVLDRAQQLARLRHHFEIWWDVMLAMDKQAKMNTNQVTDDVIREEVIRLGEDNRELRRERDRMTVQRDLAEKRVEELTLKLDGACRERDQSILTVMNTARQSMPVPGRNNNSRVPRRESSHLPYNSPERFNNPKFPDAPVFSGDRGAFDSWRDKVQDKLMNSAAQYPNEEQRIAYIRSRTDGIAYQQIRAHVYVRPSHYVARGSKRKVASSRSGEPRCTMWVPQIISPNILYTSCISLTTGPGGHLAPRGHSHDPRSDD